MYWSWIWWLIEVAEPCHEIDWNGDKHMGYFTCEYCMHQKTCEFAFDWYNTEGDCLAMK